MRNGEQMFRKFHQRTQHHRTINQLISKREKCVFRFFFFRFSFYISVRRNFTWGLENECQIVNKFQMSGSSAFEKHIFFVIFTHSLHSTNWTTERMKKPSHASLLPLAYFVRLDECYRRPSRTCNYERFSDSKQHIWPSLPNRMAGKNGLDGELAHVMRPAVNVFVRKFEDVLNWRE